jgi:hypothetical protein
VEFPSAGPNKLVAPGPKADCPAGRFIDENMRSFGLSTVNVAW